MSGCRSKTARTELSSPTSRVTNSAPSSLDATTASICQSPTTTGTSRCKRARATRQPMNPVPPVTRNFIDDGSFLFAKSNRICKLRSMLKHFEDYELQAVRETISRTITEADIVLHAGQTGDFYPQHMDAE